MEKHKNRILILTAVHRMTVNMTRRHTRIRRLSCFDRFWISLISSRSALSLSLPPDRVTWDESRSIFDVLDIMLALLAKA